MKRIVPILLTAVFLLSGCSGGSENETSVEETTAVETTTAEETTEAVTTEKDTSESTPLTENIPLVTYDDIKTGSYIGKKVWIKCVLDNFSYSESIDMCSFSVWIVNGDNYVPDDSWIVFRDHLNQKQFDTLASSKSGDVYEFAIQVEKDNSFGGTSVFKVNKSDETVDITTLETQYKSACLSIPCNDLLRSPDNFKGSDLLFSGEIFQIVSEKDNNITFLLSTGEENGYVYVHYTFKEGEERLLENDKITVYGRFYKLFSYSSQLRTKQTIPELYSKYINRTN